MDQQKIQEAKKFFKNCFGSFGSTGGFPKEAIIADRAVSIVFEVTINYRYSLREMIEAGNYNWFDDDINDKNFTIKGRNQHKVELTLIRMSLPSTTEEVLDYLNSQNLKPARLEHLLTFGATYPEITSGQFAFPIVALGSVWVDDDGNYKFPYLDCPDGERKLCLYCPNSMWINLCRFLALCK